MTNTDPLVHEYLTRLEDAARSLPPGHRVELLHDITGHLSAAQDAAPDELALRTALDRLGEPEEVVSAYAEHATDRLVPGVASSARGTRTPAGPPPRRGRFAVATILAVSGLVLLLAGAADGLRPRGFCGSPLRPAVDPGGFCAPLLDGPRVLAVALLMAGAIAVAAAAVGSWRARRG